MSGRVAIMAAVVLAANGVLAQESTLPVLVADALPLIPVASSGCCLVPPLRVLHPGATGYSWSGLYAGGSFGYGRSPANAFGSLMGALNAGYNQRVSSHVLLGAEGDISFPDLIDDGTVRSGNPVEKLGFVSTARARAGYAGGRWFVYGTGGFAWAQSRFVEETSTASTLTLRDGWVVGAGAELALAPSWSLRLEYLFDHLGQTTAELPSGYRGTSPVIDLHDVRVGLEWHPEWPAGDEWPLGGGDWWNVHGQFTYVEQGYPAFHSPYQGPNSLPGSGQVANTATATIFLGARLWRGAEAYFDPELDQGFGVGGTLGMAGFPNGEAQKAGYPVPRFNYDRLFLRQTFGLGGGTEAVADGPNQLPGTRDVSRVTVTIGKMSVGDLFDVNTYANDPRTQFLNWNVFGGGAFDWTMDRPGWTWGAVVELNQRRWALRLGYFLVPTVSNANTFDTHLLARGEYDAELELPFSHAPHSGKLRLFGWLNRANMGSYEAALAMTSATPGYPDITQTREVRVNYGFVANLEQPITSDFGLFSRASWSPGLVEIIGWTDCDWSVSLGASMNGARWRRPNDTLGVAGLIEGLSPEARAYFAAGGLGILIGDGRMNYRPEKVIEAYYACHLLEWLTLTFDYQLAADPAYNADRGPISIFAGRLHVEF